MVSNADRIDGHGDGGVGIGEVVKHETVPEISGDGTQLQARNRLQRGFAKRVAKGIGVQREAEENAHCEKQDGGDSEDAQKDGEHSH